ncbi:MAG: hypothetical protein ABR537_13395 [Gemmatimonadales bacterium]
MRFVLPALLIAVAACSKDSSGPSSAFRCLNDTLPTTGPATLAVTGQVESNALSPAPLSGAAVAAFRTGDTTTLASGTSNTPGFYSLQILTGGTPLDGYIRLTHSGYLPTYGYPPRPLVADATENVLMITSTEMGLLGAAAGVTQTAGKGFVAVIVEDCDGTALTGATVSTTPAGTVRYNTASGPSSTATSTVSDGVAYVFNVTAGNVVVSATGGGHTLRQHTVDARADALTLTQVQP